MPRSTLESVCRVLRVMWIGHSKVGFELPHSQNFLSIQIRAAVIQAQRVESNVSRRLGELIVLMESVRLAQAEIFRGQYFKTLGPACNRWRCSSYILVEPLYSFSRCELLGPGPLERCPLCLSFFYGVRDCGDRRASVENIVSNSRLAL